MNYRKEIENLEVIAEKLDAMGQGEMADEVRTAATVIKEYIEDDGSITFTMA